MKIDELIERLRRDIVHDVNNKLTGFVPIEYLDRLIHSIISENITIKQLEQQIKDINKRLNNIDK